MKIKSREKDVFLEKWKTPVGQAETLWLSAVFQSVSHTHFFFSIARHFERLKKKRDVHVMTIGRYWPYRLIEEEYARSCIGRYFHPHPSEEKHLSDFPIAQSRTWKIWGTSFIHELDRGKALSDYKEERDKNIFEYFILTEGEWIEFVSPVPRWEVLHDTTVKTAVRRYLKEV
jgi:hypothetical protein